MEIQDYQTRSRSTALYPDIGARYIYPTLGLTNEAGDVAGKIKKIFRDRGGVLNDADREALQGELGDVLWYLAQLCTDLGLSLDDVAQANLAKLASRQARGVLQGDGDHR